MRVSQAYVAVSGCGFALASFTPCSEFWGISYLLLFILSWFVTQGILIMAESRLLVKTNMIPVLSALQTCILGGLVYGRAVLADRKKTMLSITSPPPPAPPCCWPFSARSG